MGVSAIREEIAPRCSSIEEQIAYNREERDLWNAKVRNLLDQRNELNRQVKELITEVQNLKILRDEANGTVRELKEIRAQRTEELKLIRIEFRDRISKSKEIEEKREKVKKTRSPSSIKNEMNRLEMLYEQGKFLGKKERDYVLKMKNLSSELKQAKVADKGDGIRALKIKLRDAERKQDEAHRKVKKAVTKAQEAHDLMAELSDEVDRLRSEANNTQSGVTRAKREADSLHARYIVALRCIHSMQDLLKAIDNRTEGRGDEEDHVEVSDLMTRLMSGDTLSTDEIMALQRN